MGEVGFKGRKGKVSGLGGKDGVGGMFYAGERTRLEGWGDWGFRSG